MTEAELAAIVEGIAPVVRDYVKAATQRHELELATLREAVLTQLRTFETRTAELEMRCGTLETRALLAETQVQNLEAPLTTVRS
jgi:hypothetical protein